jgi:hypothetical protein
MNDDDEFLFKASSSFWSALLSEHDIKRSPSWVNLRKAELKGSGVKIKSD